MSVSQTLPWNDRLRQERTLRNWRQQDLADHLGTTVLTVQRWERGSHHPSAYFRIKLCALFGKSTEELFGEPISQEQKEETLDLHTPPETAAVPPVSSSSTFDPSCEKQREKHPDGKYRERTVLCYKVLASFFVVVLVLAFSLLRVIPFSACLLTACSSVSSPHTPSPAGAQAVQDLNLSVRLVDVVSPSFVLYDDPGSHTANDATSRSMSAVSLATPTATYDKIIVEVRNLRHAGVDILIDYVALKLLAVPALPRPLKVWAPGVTTTYLAYAYPVTYGGQTPGLLLYADPPQKVILKPEETEKLSIQILSTVTASLQFRIQIAYQVAGANREPPLTLPQTFQVAFFNDFPSVSALDTAIWA